MQWKVRHSADFAGTPEAVAMEDLRVRIGHYEKVYETVEEHEGAYIKLFYLKAKVHACNIYGRMSKSVVSGSHGRFVVPPWPPCCDRSCISSW